MKTYWFVTFEITSVSPTFGVITFDGCYKGGFYIDSAIERINKQYNEGRGIFQLKSFHEISEATYYVNDKYEIL